MTIRTNIKAYVMRAAISGLYIHTVKLKVDFQVKCVRGENLVLSTELNN